MLAAGLVISTMLSYFAFSVDTHEQGFLGAIVIAILWMIGPQLALGTIIEWTIAVPLLLVVGVLALFLMSGLWRQE